MKKFAVIPNRVPVEDIIANADAGIRGLPKQKANVVPLETAVALRRSVLPKSNFEPDELKALSRRHYSNPSGGQGERYGSHGSSGLP